MKKILLFLFSIFLSIQIFSQATSGTRVTATIVPNDSLDVYPTHDAAFGRDGYRSVSTITQRNAIKTSLRKEGMEVYVKADSTIYQLRNGITNSNWFNTGSTASNGILTVDTMKGSNSNWLAGPGLVIQGYIGASGGKVQILGGSGNGGEGGNGGDVSINSGSSTVGSAGNITLTPGNGSGNTHGTVNLLGKVYANNIPVETNPNYLLVTKNDTLKKIQTIDLSIGYTVSAYASGTVYSLTNSSALCHFGTTDPAITLNKAGTYAIYWGGAAKANAATFAASQTATFKLRRTNNTAADINAATGFFTLPIMTTLTTHAGTIPAPCVIYTTTNTTDIIQLWGVLSATPSSGSIDVNQAWIMAVKLY